MIAQTPGPLHRPILRQTLVVLAFAGNPSRSGPERGLEVGYSPVPARAVSSELLDNINASAKGLAGLKSSGGNAWESTRDWQHYKSELDGKWSYLNRIRLNAMKSWGGSALGGLRGETDTVFYPFSGPDTLYADTLFPDSKVLLMAGLEPVGTMPDMGKLQQEGKLGPYLDRVETSLFTILAASFFKTKDMKNDFNNDLVDGLTPVIVVFLARQGYSIEDIQYVVLDHEGILHVRARIGRAGGAGDLRRRAHAALFPGRPGQRRPEANPGFVRLMHHLAPGVTYLKAASYLLYEDYFSTIRDAILGDSVGVVEDDSGIPFQYFKGRIGT